MEEISRKRKYIIRALLEGEVEATPLPYWDYEWTYDPTDPTLPTGSSSRAHTFGDDYVSILGLVLDMDYLGYQEIEIGISNWVNSTGSTSPQVILKTAEKDGFKTYLKKPSILVCNASGANQNVFNDSSGDHVLRMVIDADGCKLFVDDVLSDQGAGVTNNNYLAHSGIDSSDASTNSAGYRYIKWRRL